MQYKKPSWAVKQVVRETGLVEDICKCGVGHPNAEFLQQHPSFYGVHECCGCCFLEVAHARRNDPPTSHQAAASVTDLTAKQQAVLDVFKHGDHPHFSDEQMIAAYEKAGLPQQSPSGLRSRRSELVRKGLLKNSGCITKTAAGRHTRMWEAV